MVGVGTLERTDTTKLTGEILVDPGAHRKAANYPPFYYAPTRFVNRSLPKGGVLVSNHGIRIMIGNDDSNMQYVRSQNSIPSEIVDRIEALLDDIWPD